MPKQTIPRQNVPKQLTPNEQEQVLIDKFGSEYKFHQARGVYVNGGETRKTMIRRHKEETGRDPWE